MLGGFARLHVLLLQCAVPQSQVLALLPTLSHEEHEVFLQLFPVDEGSQLLALQQQHVVLYLRRLQTFLRVGLGCLYLRELRLDNFVYILVWLLLVIKFGRQRSHPRRHGREEDGRRVLGPRAVILGAVWTQCLVGHPSWIQQLCELVDVDSARAVCVEVFEKNTDISLRQLVGRDLEFHAQCVQEVALRQWPINMAARFPEKLVKLDATSAVISSRSQSNAEFFQLRVVQVSHGSTTAAAAASLRLGRFNLMRWSTLRPGAVRRGTVRVLQIPQLFMKLGTSLALPWHAPSGVQKLRELPRLYEARRFGVQCDVYRHNLRVRHLFRSDLEAQAQRHAELFLVQFSSVFMVQFLEQLVHVDASGAVVCGSSQLGLQILQTLSFEKRRNKEIFLPFRRLWRVGRQAASLVQVG
mmetsp:Transcript_2534/g.6340  ORF Transcript_2534/g.6340 Transcript_2534/m.6340 type:complete len:412 (+) Transcript_2534:609-1844(+)